MYLLLLVSVIWAFSFGLTKGKLAGLDSAFISAARLSLAFLVFLPFLRLRGITLRLGFALAGIGALQFGIMYLAYNESYRHLAAYEVALFTLTTPFFVTLFADALDRRLHLRALFGAALAVLAGFVVTYRSANIAGTATGVLLLQFANAVFALGQVLYRRLRAHHTSIRDRDVFGLLYAGAVAVVLPVILIQRGFVFPAITSIQAATLIYLGVLSSGICFFWWNLGATRVSAGTLAVFNNAKIPLGVACSLLLFNESANLTRLLISGVLLVVAVAIAKKPAAIPKQ